MTGEQFVISALAVLPFSLWLLCYAGDRCTRLDVATGRRSRMSLIDDYGSNRGAYWPWTPLMAVAALVSAPGVLLGAAGLFVFLMGG